MRVIARRDDGDGAEAPSSRQPQTGSSRLYATPEIGTLQRVILRRPRLKLRRLTPAGKNGDE